MSGCGGGPWQSEEIAKEWLKLAVVGFGGHHASLLVFIRYSNEYNFTFLSLDWPGASSSLAESFFFPKDRYCYSLHGSRICL